jgi:hypothetical protein
VSTPLTEVFFFFGKKQQQPQQKKQQTNKFTKPTTHFATKNEVKKSHTNTYNQQPANQKRVATKGKATT